MYGLLDDIDTASDFAKSDHQFNCRLANATQARRGQVVWRTEAAPDGSEQMV